MSQLKTFFGNFTTLLEEYLLAEDQQKYLEALSY
jgi:hypothetical protein